MNLLQGQTFGPGPGQKPAEPASAPTRPPLRLITPNQPAFDAEQSSHQQLDAGVSHGANAQEGHVWTKGPLPDSPANRRTKSGLLPDKPQSMYTVFPRPGRFEPQNFVLSGAGALAASSRSGHGPSSQSFHTSQRFPGTLDTSQANLQRNVDQVSPASPGGGAYAQPFGIARYLSGTDAGSQKPHPVQRMDSKRASSPREIQADMLKAHPPPPPPVALDQHYYGIIGHNQRRKSRKRKTRSDSRPETFFSAGSETEFEGSEMGGDTHDDMPEPVSALTAELPCPFPATINRPSTPPRSPLRESQVVYPTIPQSAAESPASRSRVLLSHNGRRGDDDDNDDDALPPPQQLAASTAHPSTATLVAPPSQKDSPRATDIKPGGKGSSSPASKQQKKQPKLRRESAKH